MKSTVVKPKKRSTAAPSDRWLVVAEAQETFGAFRRSWKALSQERRHTWLKTLAVAWLGLGVLMLLLVWLGRAVLDDSMIAAEEDLLRRIVEAAPFSFSNAIFLESPGNAVILIPITIIAALVAARKGRALPALSILSAYFMLGTMVILGWTLWDHPRPDVIAGGIASPSFGGFPSGHTAQALSVFGLLAYFWVRKSPWRAERIFAVVLLLLLVSVVATARLVMGAHLMSDIVAGVIMGGAWLTMLIVLLRRAEAPGPG